MMKNERISTRSAPTADRLVTRATVSVVAQSAREEDRSVEFVAATERPCRVPDWDRMEMVDEVLLMSGLVINEKRQVPFLDSHERRSVGDVLGSMREFGTEAGQLVGRAFFSKKQKAYDAWRDVAEGHITDVSVGYRVVKAIWIPEGTSQAIDGREFAGPVKVVTSWELKEVSLCPIGADPLAKARAEELTPQNHVESPAGTAREKSTQEDTPMETKPVEVAVPATPPAPPVDTEALKREAIEADRKRAAEVLAICQEADVPEEMARSLTASATVEEARAKVLDHVLAARKTAPVAGVVELGEEATDKIRAAVVDGILLRNQFKVDRPAPGAQEFRGMSLVRIGEELLRARGVNTRGMTAYDIAGAVLGIKSHFGSRGAYAIASTSADFTHILTDAQNKSMQKAYEEYPSQALRFVSVTEVPDFKTIYRPQLSEAADLDEIPEAGAYTEMKFNDTLESYALASYGRSFTVTRKAIVNDDQRAFSRIPRALGAAAKRKIDQLVFAILVDNGNMHDGNALFVAGHNNIHSGAAFSADEVGDLMAVMRKQKGSGEDTAYLDIMMKYLIVPVALEFKAQIVCASATYPVATYPTNMVNPVKNAGIEVISSPILDASSTVKFYGAADQNLVDTIEVAFLQGNQAPLVEMIDQTNVDGRIFHVRHDIGAKALDWRGLAYHAGS